MLLGQVTILSNKVY